MFQLSKARYSMTLEILYFVQNIKVITNTKLKMHCLISIALELYGYIKLVELLTVTNSC